MALTTKALSRATRGAALVIALSPLLCISPAHAQTGGVFDLSWNTVDSGGGSSEAGLYKVHGVVGQAERGTSSGGSFAVAGGFLAAFDGSLITDPPTVTQLAFISAREYDVVFSEPMGPSALVAANYVVSGAGQGTLAPSPTSVTYSGSNRYRLTWAAGMPVGNQPLTISVNGTVADAEGETMGSPAQMTLMIPATGTSCNCGP